MKHALLRLFLILVPFVFFVRLLPVDRTQKTPTTITCPAWFGMSPIFPKEPLFQKKEEPPYYYPLVSQSDFNKQVSLLKSHLQKNLIPLDRLMLSLPIFLTKDLHWIISEKSFIFSQNQQRKELSHIHQDTLLKNYKKIYKKTALTLKSLVKKYPQFPLLLKLDGKDPQKILKQLQFLKDHRAPIYLFSLQEDFLDQVSKENLPFLKIHSFKKWVRFQILSFLPRASLLKISGDGLLLPTSLPLSQKIIFSIHQSGKILILEDSPSHPITPSLSQGINGLVSSQLSSSLKFINHKKTCFLK